MFFLRCILNCTPEELKSINAVIQAAAGQHLPDGAEVVIAECIADPALAAKFKELSQKRLQRKYRGYTFFKGLTRAEILEAARARRAATAQKKGSPQPHEPPQP